MSDVSACARAFPGKKQGACDTEAFALTLSLLSLFLSRSVVSRIALVKPSKARAIQDLLIRMAQSGQVRQKVTEQQLIGLLDQVEGQGPGGAGGGMGGAAGSSGGGAGKITVRDKAYDNMRHVLSWPSRLTPPAIPTLSTTAKRRWMMMTMTLICKPRQIGFWFSLLSLCTINETDESERIRMRNSRSPVSGVLVCGDDVDCSHVLCVVQCLWEKCVRPHCTGNVLQLA